MEFGENIAQHKKAESLREHGFTEHCRQCDHVKAFGERKGGLPHSEACRARIVESMLATPRGAARVQDAETRINRALVEQVAAGSAVLPATPADIANDAAEAAEEASEAADSVHPPRDVRAPAGPDPLEPIDKEEDEDMDVSHVTGAKLRWAVPVVPTVLISTKRRTRNHDGRPMKDMRSPYTDNSRINQDIPRTIADFRAHTAQAVLKDEDELDDAMFIGLLSNLGADAALPTRSQTSKERCCVGNILSSSRHQASREHALEAAPTGICLGLNLYRP